MHQRQGLPRENESMHSWRILLLENNENVVKYRVFIDKRNAALGAYRKLVGGNMD
jgi:hypothetical protein